SPHPYPSPRSTGARGETHWMPAVRRWYAKFPCLIMATGHRTLRAATSVPEAMISVIVCSIDQAKSEAIAAHYRSLMGDEPFEWLLIRDARSLAEGYNRAIAQSRGELLVLSHDDIEILTPAFVPRLK